METVDLLKHLEQMLKAAGFQGRGRNWSFGAADSEVVWLLQLEKVPRCRQAGMMLGADLPQHLEGPRPRRGNDCKIVLYPDSYRGAAGTDPQRFRPALDLDVEMPEEQRLAWVQEGVGCIAEFVRAHSTVSSLGVAYRAGVFRGDPITIPMQELLQNAGLE